MLGQCLKEPSCPGFECQVFLQNKEEEVRRLSKKKKKKDSNLLQVFPGSGQTQKGMYVDFFPVAIHRWAQSGCFLRAK